MLSAAMTRSRRCAISHCAVFCVGELALHGRCRAAIEKLRADNAALKEELVLENRFSMAPSQGSAAALIQSLQRQSDLYTAKAS